MNQHIEKISNEVKGVIKGKDEVISKLMMAMLAKGNVLLEDVPGVGKTTMALAFARAMGLDTKRVQFTPDTLPSDIIGFSVYDKETGELSYKEGAIVTNLLLADEINRTSVDGVTRVLPDPFIVLATENPAGSAGTQMLPNSQLDRFMVKLSIGYPDVESQAEILADRHTENPVDNVEQVVSEEELKDMIKNANEVYIAKSVYEYIAKLVQKTREYEMVSLGVSPRGALSLCQMAKAYAFVNSRDFVTPDDIRAVFADVCGHRLMLNSKARLNELSAENILADIIKDVDIPAAESFKKML